MRESEGGVEGGEGEEGGQVGQTVGGGIGGRGSKGEGLLDIRVGKGLQSIQTS